MSASAAAVFAAGQTPQATITLDQPISLDDAVAVGEGAAQLALGPLARGRIVAAHQRLQRCIAERRLVYGVTTGFGPLADRLVAAEDGETLQRNLVYHLATGVGDDLPWATARMVVLARLSSIAQGWSGAAVSTANLLAGLLNTPYAPQIPEKGTVGASGDLTPLAHMTLALMGEGGFIGRHGEPVAQDRVFAALGRGPLTLTDRDGLALVNGTSVMTAVAARNGVIAQRLTGWAEAITVGMAELLRGRTEAWGEAFSAARPHPGQAQAAENLRRWARGASRLDTDVAAARILARRSALGEVGTDDRALQDAYTLRCAPQLIGAARDMAAHHDAVVTRELNAATDNPIFPDDPAGPPALHGGNFMGQHVAFASDSLRNAVLGVAILAERQIARVTDERLNGGLPAFLHCGPAGLNSGLMGAQVTASALIAELRAKSTPASVQSISTNGANQDVVSMGTIAARGCADALTDVGRVLAIAALAVAQGVDCVGVDSVSPAARRLRDWVRAKSDPLVKDRPLSADIERVAMGVSATDFASLNVHASSAA